jgi:hypothetical protein
MKKWSVGDATPETVQLLSEEMSGSALSSLLLHVMRDRAGRRNLSEVLAQYQRDPFTGPSPVDQRTLVEVDSVLLGAASGYEALELSPVTPLGTSSAMALSDQHRVLSALRNSEVVSDPTNVLALECARRLRGAPQVAVHLTTSQRVIRAQPAPKQPGFSQHFRIFVLASGGVETREHAFTVDTLVTQVRTLLLALDRLEAAGYSFGARRVDLLATDARARLAERAASELKDRVVVARRLLDHAYYSGGLRFMLWVTALDGEEVPLADGGSFDWLARLLSNRRAVFVASGLGAQLVPIRFRRPVT